MAGLGPAGVERGAVEAEGGAVAVAGPAGVLAGGGGMGSFASACAATRSSTVAEGAEIDPARVKAATERSNASSDLRARAGSLVAVKRAPSSSAVSLWRTVAGRACVRDPPQPAAITVVAARSAPAAAADPPRGPGSRGRAFTRRRAGFLRGRAASCGGLGGGADTVARSSTRWGPVVAWRHPSADASRPSPRAGPPPQRRIICASTSPSRQADSAALATARSWTASPVESNIVTAEGSGRPRAAPRSTAPSSVT